MEMHGVDGATGEWGVLGVLVWLISLLFLTGILTTILLTIRLLSGRRGAALTDPAENILRERFARGEIPAEEYEKSMETLRANTPHRNYEDYIRDAMNRLKFGRDTNP